MTDAAAQSMAGTIPVVDKDRLDLGKLTAWMSVNIEGFADRSPTRSSPAVSPIRPTS